MGAKRTPKPGVELVWAVMKKAIWRPANVSPDHCVHWLCLLPWLDLHRCNQSQWRQSNKWFVLACTWPVVERVCVCVALETHGYTQLASRMSLICAFFFFLLLPPPPLSSSMSSTDSHNKHLQPKWAISDALAVVCVCSLARLLAFLQLSPLLQ